MNGETSPFDSALILSALPRQGRRDVVWPRPDRALLEAPWLLDLDDADRGRFLMELSDVMTSATMDGSLLDVASLLTRWSGKVRSLDMQAVGD